VSGCGYILLALSVVLFAEMWLTPEGRVAVGFLTSEAEVVAASL